MSGLAVLGGSSFARVLAAREGAALLDVEARDGPWLGRRVNADTGEGIRAALAHVDRLIVVLDHPSEMHGLFLVLRPEEKRRFVAFIRWSGIPEPKGLARWPEWATAEIGWPWGPGDPLFDAWSTAAARGATLEAPDVGPVPVVPMAEAVDLATSLMDRPGIVARWPGTSTGLPELAERIAPGRVRRVRGNARWARLHGISLDAVTAWTLRPAGPRSGPPLVSEGPRQ